MKLVHTLVAAVLAISTLLGSVNAAFAAEIKAKKFAIDERGQTTQGEFYRGVDTLSLGDTLVVISRLDAKTLVVIESDKDRQARRIIDDLRRQEALLQAEDPALRQECHDVIRAAWVHSTALTDWRENRMGGFDFACGDESTRYRVHYSGPMGGENSSTFSILIAPRDAHAPGYQLMDNFGVDGIVDFGQSLGGETYLATESNDVDGQKVWQEWMISACRRILAILGEPAKVTPSTDAESGVESSTSVAPE